jgi:hypothetical protein
MILLLLLATGSRTAAPITVSCVGDSITVADGNECYPNQLAKLLGSGYNVTNRGVSGHTSSTVGCARAAREDLGAGPASMPHQ